MLLEIRADETAVVRPLVQRIRGAVHADEAMAARHEVDERAFLRRGKRQFTAGQREHDDVVATQCVGGDEREIFGRGDRAQVEAWELARTRHPQRVPDDGRRPLQPRELDVGCLIKSAADEVANFVELATGRREWRDPRDRATKTEPLYDGTVFHRVIPGFMIQGGDPEGTGRGGPGYAFADECPPGGPSFDRPGLLAMANAGPNTNGSQFFVTVAPTPHLTGKHTIFGEVADEASQRVVDAIATAKTDRDDRPIEEIVIERIEVDRAS